MWNVIGGIVLFIIKYRLIHVNDSLVIPNVIVVQVQTTPSFRIYVYPCLFPGTGTVGC